MAKQSKYDQTVAKMKAQYADQDSKWYAAIAFDNTSGIYTWPVIGSLFEFMRPSYAALVSQDKLILSKLSGSGNQDSPPIILNRSDVQDLKYKKGVVESSVKFQLKDGTKLGLTMFRKQRGMSEEYAQATEMIAAFK